MENRNLIFGVLWGITTGINASGLVRCLSNATTSYAGTTDYNLNDVAIWAGAMSLSAGLSIYNFYKANRIRKSLEDEQ